MSLKTVSDSSTGDSTHVGGSDWNKVARLLTGTSNVINVDINSLFKFRDSKCQFVNGANTLTMRTAFIDRTLSYYFPKPFDNNDDTLLTERGQQPITNKTIDASSNSMTGFVQLPAARKWGAIMVGPNVTAPGLGLLNGHSNLPATPVFQVGQTNGINWRFNSSGTANTSTGIEMQNDATLNFTCRPFHPMIRAKTRVLSGPSGTRQYIGFTTRPRLPASDTPISSNESGILVGWRTSDATTAIQVIRNSGTSTTSSTPSVTTTGVVPSTGVTQFEVSFPNDTEARVRILSARGTTVTWDSQTSGGNFTTNIPALAATASDVMMPHCVYSSTATNTNYDLYFVQIEQDQ